MDDWALDGTHSSQTIHNFGSVTLVQRSNNYDVQAPIFAFEKERRLPLDIATLMAENV